MIIDPGVGVTILLNGDYAGKTASTVKASTAFLSTTLPTAARDAGTFH